MSSTDAYDPDNYDSLSATPLTKAVRDCWNVNFATPTVAEAALDPVPKPSAMHAILNAVWALEKRVQTLENAS